MSADSMTKDPPWKKQRTFEFWVCEAARSSGAKWMVETLFFWCQIPFSHVELGTSPSNLWRVSPIWTIDACELETVHFISMCTCIQNHNILADLKIVDRLSREVVSSQPSLQHQFWWDSPKVKRCKFTYYLLTCTRVMLYRLHIACKLGISAEGPCSTCPYIDHIHPYTYIPYICIYLCMIYYLLNFLTDRHQTDEIRIGEQIIASPCDADSWLNGTWHGTPTIQSSAKNRKVGIVKGRVNFALKGDSPFGMIVISISHTIPFPSRI